MVSNVKENPVFQRFNEVLQRKVKEILYTYPQRTICNLSKKRLLELYQIK